MLIAESDGPPSWSLDASETGESTKCPWVGVMEGTTLSTPSPLPTGIFFIYNFHLLFAALLLCQAAREETIRFLVFKLIFTSAFRSLTFPCFLKCYFF